MKFVNITPEGNLFVSQPIMDCIRSYFYDLYSQVRTKSRQEFLFGERSARATVQAFQWIFREEIRKHFNCYDEESLKGLVWRQSIVKEFLCLVKERSDQLVQYETATCCSLRNKTKPITYDDHLNGFKRAFQAANVVINHWVTHLMRGQSRRILHEVGSHRDAILQQGGQLHDTLEDNYLQGPNNEALVILAGGFEEDPSLFVPCRYVALYNEFPSIDSRNDLVYSFCPIFQRVNVACKILIL